MPPRIRPRFGVCAALRPWMVAWPMVALAGQEPAAPPHPPEIHQDPPRVAEADRILRETLEALECSGAGLVLLHDGNRVHQSTIGNWRADHVVPIASATKWLTVATILTLVDSGTFALDTEVSAVLPEFEAHRGLTLAHLLSCTHGLSGRALFKADDETTLTGLAQAIATSRVHEPPGTALRYGVTGFVVAARMAEAASGSDWHTLFRERLAEPLGMTHTRYGRIRRGKVVDAGTTQLPWVAGGAESTLDDYARFVAMLQRRGQVGERRVLSEAAVTAMFSPRTDGLDVRFSPYRKQARVAYGLGTWIEQRDEHGAARLVSDGGAFGWMPWLDLEHGVAGVFAVKDDWKHVVRCFVPRRGELVAAIVDGD